MTEREVFVNENGALAYVQRNYMSKSEADELLHDLKTNIPFISGEEKKIMMYGKLVAQTRQSYVMGDEGVIQRYSGTSYQANPWHPKVLEFKKQIEEQLGLKLNSCLINEYSDGKSAIGYHSDRECWDKNDIVVILSLGATRRFYMRRKSDKKVLKTLVNHGDCMVMYGTMQQYWKHAVPKMARAGYRLSLSFRLLKTTPA